MTEPAKETTNKFAYKRVLLKVSGEALMGEQAYGIDVDVARNVAEELKRVHELGVEVAVVVGGGNIFRGVSKSAGNMDRSSADYIGMLATVMNAVVLQDALEKVDVHTRVLSAIDIPQLAESFIRRRAVRHLEKGRIVIFAAGTGNPYFTTDSAAALRALEIKAPPVATPTGRLVAVQGLLLESVGCRLHTGQRCRVEAVDGSWLDAQVVGFRDKITYLMPFKQADGLVTGARVLPATGPSSIQIGPSWMGRMVNGLGEPIDGLGKLGGDATLPTTPPKVNPLKKAPVEEPLDVGVRAINSMLTIGRASASA